jgi:hypothetical protein
VSDARTVRVWVPSVWDVVELPAGPGQTFAGIKAGALEQALGTGRANQSDYIVKFRGALVEDENRTLESLAVPDRAPLIVLPARRRPVS